MKPRVSRQVKIELGGTTIQVGELLDILEEFPRESLIDIHYYSYPSKDPRKEDTALIRVIGPRLEL